MTVDTRSGRRRRNGDYDTDNGTERVDKDHSVGVNDLWP
jgi:hypothetical protein